MNTIEPVAKNTNSALQIEFTCLPALNFALQQNHVPIVRTLFIQNTGTEVFTDVRLQMVSEPEFMPVWTQTIPAVQPGERLEIKNKMFKISGDYLANVTERTSAHLILSVFVEGEKVIQQEVPIDLLTYEQWNGAALLPELLSAFITPNHPEIPQVIRKAADILKRWTGNPSFDEYQTRNPDRVRKQMAAIYEAIAEMNIIYCSAPASFEERGQRVRLADVIFKDRLANCLDLTLLYAACLEAVGIHPLVVVVKGHAFAGAWLIDESFADSVNDDPSLISKRTADGINDIVVVEATGMNAGQLMSFDDAVRSADQKMKVTEDFLLFIDVKRSRFSGIRPLPTRIAILSGWQIPDQPDEQRVNMLPEDISVGEKLVHAEKIELTKQRLWERKLLDLTLRNSLLNVRITRSVVQFMLNNVHKLEDALADGAEFQVLSKPSDWENNLRDAGLYAAIHQTDPITQLVEHELAHKRIRTYLSDQDLALSLTNIYRASRLSIEENGANTLYVGLGLLKWYETDISERPRFAPILLIPVEIIRKTAQKGYVIRSREEEAIMNITLLEMIRQDFGISIGGLDVLPKDENGVDVKLIFNTIRQAIMVKSRWDVEEQAVLGTFSFSKFILWNDIHHNAHQLQKNKVVASLMSGKLEWQPEVDSNTVEISDVELRPEDIALPISTDSSQLHAIFNSGRNRSFVLHGPPGTGKSQTITNIIANALYAGKKVLFVAAKKAALDVVESRLKSIGLSPFCLELHSNKSKKSAVLEQLKTATEIAAHQLPENFQTEASRLHELRTELNAYVAALHQKQSFGLSLYDLFSRYSAQNAKGDAVYFPDAVVPELTEAKLQQWQDLAEEIQGISTVIGQPDIHPLKELKPKEYHSGFKQEVQTGLQQLLQVLPELMQQIEKVKSVLKIDSSIDTEGEEVALVRLASLLLKLGDVPASIFQIDAFEQTLAQIEGVAEIGMQRDLLRSELLEKLSREGLTLPASQLLINWNMATEQWFLSRWFKQNSILKSLRVYTKTGSLEKTEIPALLNKIIDCQDRQSTIDQAHFLPQTLGFLWQNGACNWNEIKVLCATLVELNRAASVLFGVNGVAAWRRRLSTEFSEGSKAYFMQHGAVLDQFLHVQQHYSGLKTQLQNSVGLDFTAQGDVNLSQHKMLSALATQWLENIDQLKDWYNWLDLKNRALTNGLQPLVKVFEEGLLQPDQIVSAYLKGVYRAAAEHIIAQKTQLATFNGTLFNEKIKKFRDISNRFEQLTKDEIYARLAAKIPSFVQEASQSSEIGLLQKAIRNNGRALSVRKIFDSIPLLLPRLKPCMLMSPISVAQYFDANETRFDLVIFDEASQMPTCEAVGAIARGSHVIVVGDPKQMPPTNFFNTNNIDEENIEKEDLESILDDCLALSMPSQHLLWHYRSKHESLIAFSNAKYYDNKLLTFPSKDDLSSKVQFVHVDGHYDKGKSRQNRFEAKEIVNEVVRRLSDPQLAARSIGIVTFSSTQQILIEDLLNEVFNLRPDLEKIALDADEPLFIKNLENVQGDERDVILFSVGYGPDETGKVGLNFGPINREGGWRRLNVAVSRARYEMKVFSTLKADQINLNRTGSEGVAGLKAFLAYAEKGKSALPFPVQQKTAETNALEDEIANEIRKHGYEVHTQIGASTYKVNLAIVDKKDPGNYILGILTDGKNYHAAPTSRDREIVQVDVLAMLGWKLHKVWLLEWWENIEKVLNGILAQIQIAETETAQQIKPEVFLKPDVRIDEFKSLPLSDEIKGSAERSVKIADPALKPVIYEVCTLDVMSLQTADDLMAPQNKVRIKTQIFNVMETEAPISKTLLTKRILSAWGINRLGGRTNDYLDSVFAQLEIKTRAGERNVFFWKKNQEPESYAIYRTSEQESEKRDADDLPPEEVAVVAERIVRNQIGLSKSDLIREMARAFGYARIGTNVERAMLEGLQIAINKGIAKEDGERIVLQEN